MHNRSLLLLTFILVIILGSLHLLASTFYFYWTLWWFDNLMHFLGGLSLGLLALWTVYVSGVFGKKRPTLTQAVFTVLVIVLVIGGLWEVFEYVLGITQATEESYRLDVIHDLIADTLGALTAGVVGRWQVFYKQTGKYNG